MNEYERAKLVLEGRIEELDRVPCSCYGVGVFTTESLSKANAEWLDAFKDAEKMAKIASIPHRLCGLESITVPHDILVEAEAIGMMPDFRKKQAKRGKYIWPNIMEREMTKDGTKIEKAEDLPIPDDIANAGRIPVVTKALKILHEEFYGKVPVCVRTVAPFTALTGYIMDTIKFFMKAKTNPEEIINFYERMKQFTIELTKIYFEAGADIVNFTEDGASCDSIAPPMFRELIKPQITDIFKKSGANTMTMSGTALPIIKDCAETGAKVMTIDEKTDVSKAKAELEAMKPAHKMALAGNVPTVTLLGKKGKEEKIKEYIKGIIEKGIDVVSPGSDFFITTPLENIKVMVEATKEYGVKK